jgi:hypothetical protein
LRIVAGGIASGHVVTPWLLAFSRFTFLSLALVERTGEMVPIGQSDSHHTDSRRGYRPDDLPILQMFGIASAFAASVVLALFVNSTAAIQPYSSPELLWGLVPLILFWRLRLWLSTERGDMNKTRSFMLLEIGSLGSLRPASLLSCYWRHRGRGFGNDIEE